ncbi:reverse transcriptase domain-containing protein [Tanacetum coccineum]
MTPRQILTMSTNEQTPLSQPTSVVRNTLRKEQAWQDLGRPISDEALREYCDKNYHQILPIIAKKVHQEKVQQEKLKAVKAHRNFEETSRHFESGTSSKRRSLEERLGSRHARSMSGNPEPRRGRSKSPREREIQGIGHTTVAAETLKAATRVLAPEKQNLLLRNIITKERPREEQKHYRKVKVAQEDTRSRNQRSKSRALRTTCPNHGEYPEDHLKIFQAAAKTEHWAMPTWCHMFNSTLTGNARKKYIKDPVEIHNIKQRYGESTKEFVRRYKLDYRDMKGAPECMKISGFMYGFTNPKLIKRLHDKIPKSLDEMMRVTTAFLRGEVAALNCERKKSFPSWKQQEAGLKQNFKKGGFRNQQRPKLKQDMFTLLTKTPKEILALDKGKFKPPPPMTTPIEKRNANKFCEFHGEVGHTTDVCMHLKRQIEEMLKAGKLLHLIKELKQSNGKDQAMAAKKEETSGKDKSLAILMVQPWQRVARKKITQTFSPESVISFPLLGEEDGTEGPMIIKAEMRGHCVHYMYVDGGSSLEILYEHCFKRFCPEVRNQMIPATTPLVGFSGEIIWSLGKISLLVKIGDEEHSTSALMNFMVVRSPSPYNGIIGRPGVRRIRAVPSTAHGMLKFPVAGRTVTLRSSRIIPLECIMVSGPGVPQRVINQVTEEKIQVAIHPEYPEQTIAIGSTLTEEGRKELCDLLRRNLDIFVWKPPDMTGVPWHIAEHMLNIREGYLPVGQKKKGQAPERNKVIYEEVEKLVDADIMKKVHYHSCLSNPVMVKKHYGSWRMCVDFKDLNKAYPKDGYPLPEIDWKVESLGGYPFKCFLDACKGYHQIKMAEEDKEKTAFITSQGIFCYSKMSFRLKNVKATYQRLVDKAF